MASAARQTLFIPADWQRQVTAFLCQASPGGQQLLSSPDAAPSDVSPSPSPSPAVLGAGAAAAGAESEQQEQKEQREQREGSAAGEEAATPGAEGRALHAENAGEAPAAPLWGGGAQGGQPLGDDLPAQQQQEEEEEEEQEQKQMEEQVEERGQQRQQEKEQEQALERQAMEAVGPSEGLPLAPADGAGAAAPMGEALEAVAAARAEPATLQAATATAAAEPVAMEMAAAAAEAVLPAGIAAEGGLVGGQAGSGGVAGAGLALEGAMDVDTAPARAAAAGYVQSPLAAAAPAASFGVDALDFGFLGDVCLGLNVNVAGQQEPQPLGSLGVPQEGAQGQANGAPAALDMAAEQLPGDAAARKAGHAVAAAAAPRRQSTRQTKQSLRRRSLGEEGFAAAAVSKK
jgi:hypothetical protein